MIALCNKNRKIVSQSSETSGVVSNSGGKYENHGENLAFFIFS
jgi:hypothetical protein